MQYHLCWAEDHAVPFHNNKIVALVALESGEQKEVTGEFKWSLFYPHIINGD